jgi:hypothetical protein
MPLRLTRTNPFPPGEFVYEQVVDGRVVKWPGEGKTLEEQARRVAAFRHKNNLPRSSVHETLDDISIFTCQRLGGMKQYCGDGSVQVVYHGRSGGGCKGCGARV